MMLWQDNDCDSVKSAFAFCAGSANLTFPQECGQAKKCYSQRPRGLLLQLHRKHIAKKNNFKVEERRNLDGELIVGDTVTNALFHFSR